MSKKLTIISDTHGHHEDLTLPGGDILIHCGDISNVGDPVDVALFLDWLHSQEYTHKVFICGNHELGVEDNELLYGIEHVHDWIQEGQYPDVHYLFNSDVVLDGIKIWGSPHTPTFNDWAFMKDRGSIMESHWRTMPNDVDVLVTHGPPAGILDSVDDPRFGRIHVGCEELRTRVIEVKPKIHCFGHIHEGYGMLGDEDTTFINASCMDRQYRLVNAPVEVEL